EVRIAGEAEDLGVLRVDREDAAAVAEALQIRDDPRRAAHPLRGSNDRYARGLHEGREIDRRHGRTTIALRSAGVKRAWRPRRGGGYFRRGSRASRRPSPKRLKPSTVTKMAMPGKSEIQGLDWMNATLAFRSQPQLGVGGWVPSPRKESVASTMIEVAMPSVVVTMIGARQFGRTWRRRIHGSRTPSARHASMYSFSLMDRTLPLTRRA